MKRRLATLIAGALLMCAGSAWSYTMADGTDVGGLDSLAVNKAGALGHADLKDAGDADQLKWVNGFLGTNYSSFSYVDKDIKSDFKPVYDGKTAVPSVYGYDLHGTPEYFLIKTGNLQLPKPNNYDTFLFKNNENFNWAVIDLDAYQISGLGKLSKLDEVGTAPVPEPGTMMLLGAGFLGLAVYGKRRRNA